MEIHNAVEKAANKTIPKKKISKKAKRLSEEAFRKLKKEEKRKKTREKGKGIFNSMQISKEQRGGTRRPSSMNSV